MLHLCCNCYRIAEIYLKNKKSSCFCSVEWNDDCSYMQDDGDTPLHIASARGFSCIVMELLKSRNIKVDATNKVCQRYYHFYAAFTSAFTFYMCFNKYIRWQ